MGRSAGKNQYFLVRERAPGDTIGQLSAAGLLGLLGQCGERGPDDNWPVARRFELRVHSAEGGTRNALDRRDCLLSSFIVASAVKCCPVRVAIGPLRLIGLRGWPGESLPLCVRVCVCVCV